MFDYADGDGHELAFLWFESIAGTVASRGGHVDRAFGKCLGSPILITQSNESKEAIASYPEIQKELRLALQSVGRKLGMYMKRREKVKHEGERRSIFMRYLGEVATAVSGVNGMSRQELFDALVASAKRKTATADVLLGEDGMPMEEENFGENVIVVA